MPLCGIDDDDAADLLLALFGLSGGCSALTKVFGCGEDTRAAQLGYDSIAHMCPNVCDACAPPTMTSPSTEPSISPSFGPSLFPQNSPSSAPTELCNAVTVTCGTQFDGVYFLRDTQVNGRPSWESTFGALLFSMEFSNALPYPGLRWVFYSDEREVMILSATLDLEFPSSNEWIEVTEDMQQVSEYDCEESIICTNDVTWKICRLVHTGISFGWRSWMK